MKILVFFLSVAAWSEFAYSAPDPKSILQIVEPSSSTRSVPSPYAASSFNTESHNEVVATFFNTIALVEGLLRSADGKLSPGSGAVPGHRVSNDRNAFKFTFSPLVLPDAELIAIGPMGTFKKGLWTGAEQFYRTPAGAYVRIQEDDLSATGGKIYLNKSAVNAEVNGSVASLLTFTADDGRRFEELLWTADGRMITLSLGTDGRAKRNTLSAQGLARRLMGR